MWLTLWVIHLATILDHHVSVDQILMPEEVRALTYPAASVTSSNLSRSHVEFVLLGAHWGECAAISEAVLATCDQSASLGNQRLPNKRH